jgi:hypothetical protein
MYLAYKAFKAANVGGTGTSADIFPLSGNSAAPASIRIPSGGEFEGQQFIARASGRVFVHGSSPTVNVTLYGVAGDVPSSSPMSGTSYTALAVGTSAQALTTNATYPWALEALLQGDSTSGIVQVAGAKLYINGNSVSLTLTDLTGVNFLSGYQPSGTIPYSQKDGPALTLVAAITFGVSDALNVGVLNQFQVEL